MKSKIHKSANTDKSTAALVQVGPEKDKGLKKASPFIKSAIHAGSSYGPKFSYPQSAESDVRDEEFIRIQIASFVRYVRAQAGLKQDALANRVGITQGRLSQIENAHSDVPVSTLIAIASACEANVELSVSFQLHSDDSATTFRLQM